MVARGAEVVVVTGGNRGIGRSIALAFARTGASVAICGRDERALASVARELAALGVQHLCLPCDVAEPASVDSFGDAVVEVLGAPSTVVACSGVTGPTKPLHEIDPGEWTECIAIDLSGVYLTFRRFIPPMLERGSGSLIAISSITGKRPLAGRTPYAAAKLGVIGLVRTLALELGPSRIRVNAVCPGAVDGPRIQRVFEGQATALGITVDEARSAMVDDAPLRRLVRPEEVAATCLYLASDAAAAITGEDVNVSAGLVMY